MRQSRKSKDYTRKRRSSQRVTGKAGAKVGRSELHCSKQRKSGSCSLTVTGTSIPKCSKGLLPLRMTLISLLAASESAKPLIVEKSLHFSPDFILEFFSELAAIRKRALKYSGKNPSIHGPQMGFCSTSKYYPRHKPADIGSLKFPSNVKLKSKCRGGHCGKQR